MLLWGSIVALEKMSGAEWSLGGDDRGDALLYLAAGLASLQTSRLDPMAIPHCFARLISTSYSASCCNLFLSASALLAHLSMHGKGPYSALSCSSQSSRTPRRQKAETL